MAGDHLRRARVSVDDLPRSYVCYDLETTGLGAAAHVIEIGAVRVFDGWEDERLSTFVALPAGARIEPGAQAVHHISEAMLAGAPSQREAYEMFSEFVGELPLVGQNIVSFDNGFIDRMAERAHMRSVVENGSFDTMLIYRELVGRPANLAAICAHYGIENDQAHRAWADARATSDCYQAIIRDMRSRAAVAFDPEVGPVAHELDGELVCFTGNTYEHPKRLFEEIALRHGAHLHERVIKRVTMLVDLEGRESAKVRRARELGTPVITADAFLARMGLTQEDLRS